MLVTAFGGTRLRGTHISHASDVFRSGEILVRCITAAFACIVYQVFDYFTKGSPLLTEIDCNPRPAILGLLDCLLDAKSKVGSTGADIGLEYIRAVALIMNTQCELVVRIWYTLRWAENINGKTANWGQEDFNIRAGDELRVATSALLE